MRRDLTAQLEIEPVFTPATSRPPQPMAAAPPPRGTTAPPAKLAPPAPARSAEALAHPPGKEAAAKPRDADGAAGKDVKITVATRAAPGAVHPSRDAEADAPAEGEFPAELDAQEDGPLEAPPLEWQSIAPIWLAPQALPPEAMPLAAPSSASATAPSPPKGGGRAPAAPVKSPVGGSEPSHQVEHEARERASLAYLDLVRDARREQESFTDRTNVLGATMAAAYATRSGEILQAHERDLGAVDLAAERASTGLDLAASLAQATLEGASRRTSAALDAAGRNAFGLINADDRTAAQHIGAVVTGLVSGHLAAFNGAIGATKTATDHALLALKLWADGWAKNLRTDGSAYLEAAKDEKRRARIPGWVEPATKELTERTTAKTTEWGSTRDTTVCGLSCSYREALETERVRVNTQGRSSVSTALAQARRTLRDQTRDGLHALADLRRSYLGQIDHRRRTLRSGLISQARGTLAALHQEARGAVLGVEGAARGAQSAFERGPRGLEQTLRQSAPAGAAALRAAAERAPAALLQATLRESAQLDLRLQGNRTRLETSLDERGHAHDRQSAGQLAQLELGLDELGQQATEMLDRSAGGLVEAFGGLAGTVSQAAASWAQPLAIRLAGLIASKKAEAGAALKSLLTGEPPPSAGGGAPAEAAGGGAACGACATAAGPAAGAPAGAAPAAGGPAGPKGLDGQRKAEIDHANLYADPAAFFAARLEEAGSQVEDNLSHRAVEVAHKFEGGFAGTVDEEGVIAALRGLTPVQGRALDLSVYGEAGTGTLDSALRDYLDAPSSDYTTASAYLRGDAVEGARLELLDSTHWYNDDEARIEATMRALSPDQLAALGHEHADVVEEIRGVLDGTDQQVFDALAQGNYARADAFRMRDAVDSARRDDDADATHTAIERYTGAPDEGDWRASQEMEPAERRRAVVAELGLIASGADLGRESADHLSDARRAELETAAVNYVTRDVQVVRGGGEGEAHLETLSITGANRDLAGALLRHGSNSVEARAARLGVELQRQGDPPDPLKLDRATFDERFTPDRPNASPEEREANERQRTAARGDRARMLLLAAQYAPAQAGAPAPAPADHDAVMRPDFVPNPTEVAAAQSALIGGLKDRFGSDTVGGQLAAGLLSEERPSAKTASLAMQHAMYAHFGTNEELLFRFTERMNRDEIAAMREQFQKDTNTSLDAELGVYGEGSFGEVSGDDRLRMERALRGVARTDQEKLEAAAYALHQQRQETGSFGAWLAEGSLAEQVMRNTERRIERLAGGPIAFSQRGELTTALPHFSAQGSFTGTDRDAFLATTGIAQQVAENYSARIDAYADIATTGIAILGAIAAAVITVATGGAAGPLVYAAIVTGLASMAANAAIKGGRYGWEQAAVDLGMTAVQALTAGIGAQLGAASQVASKGAAAAAAASRSLATLARIFTGNPVIDQIIVGALVGSVGGLAGAAFDEHTWEHGGGDAVSSLLGGLLKGALAGGVTAAVTSSIESLGRNGAAIGERARELAAQPGLGNRALGLLGRGVGRLGSGIGHALEASTGGGGVRSAGAMAARGLTRGAISSLGGMAGRSSELLFDAASGKYKGDAGEALIEIGHAGAHSFAQGIGEGAGEAVGQAVHQRGVQAAEASINRERSERGLTPLQGEHLRAAADDLTFLNQHGSRGGDGLGRALNLEHIATHGGLAPTMATLHPEPVVLDHMRAALMRHVDPEVHGDFAHVPIRVLPEAEYHALTRSSSGPVVTLIENGHPVVVIREGTSIAHLADEGPHLAQAREQHTRERVARLDEAVLAHWDSLDLDTQLDLYHNKIELEIDAHERIGRSLAEAHARGEGDPAQLALDRERNDGTLRNLRARLEEVTGITPERRAAIDAGEVSRPQYLEQPARLFSKDAPPEAGAVRRPPEEEEAAARKSKPGEEEQPGEPGYRHQPELRGPGVAAEPTSIEGLRQQHEEWAEGLRRGYLHAGSMPPMAEGGIPKPGRPPWHADIEKAYAAYDALVREHGGRREAGIIRNVHTGEYMVVLGSPVDLRIPMESMRQETVLHFHPDYGPALFRGPSGTDLAHTAAIARASGRPVTEFIEFNVPGGGRGRTAFTVSPVPDATVPGGLRMAYDLEFHNPTTGEYTHQHFASRREWSEYYHARTAALDPDSAIYRHLLRAFGASDEQIDQRAAAHRPEGAPVPPRPDLPPPGRPRNAVFEPETLPEPGAVESVSRTSKAPGEEVQPVDREPVGAAKPTLPLPPVASTDTAPPPDALELVRLREEEHTLQDERDRRQRMHQDEEPRLIAARERVRLAEEELQPLEAARRPQEEQHRQLLAERRQVKGDLDDLELPGPGHSREERVQLIAERERLTTALRMLDSAIGGVEKPLLELGARISALNQRAAEGRRHVEQWEPIVRKLASRLHALETRLGEIAARRSSVAGPWIAEFARIREHPPCFVAGTLVHTPEGLRPIEALAAGDLVVACDTTTGHRVARRVLRPECGSTRRVLDLRIDGEVVSTTPRHRFWQPHRAEWVEAGELPPGSPLLDCHGACRLLEAAVERLAVLPTFNLLVDGEHNYFVGQAGLLVHNGKDPDELSASLFQREIANPPQPFVSRFYIIVHADQPDTIIYVGSTEQTLADRLRGHVRDRVYLRGDKAETAWLTEAGGRVLITGETATEVRSGPFIMREIAFRTCSSHFERFVWELHYIEHIRQTAGETMQNDFSSPPVGPRKFNEFRDYYLAQLCA